MMARSDRIRASAQSYVNRKQFSGIEWKIETSGNSLAAGQVGSPTADGTELIPDGAIYRIYSMTKPIVSVMAMILIEQGKLRLYDMLAQYNPAFRSMMVLLPSGELGPATRPILVEDLFTHRAGFTYEFIAGCHIAPGYDAINIAGDGQCSLDEMMTKLATQPLAFQPGSQFRYSVCTDVLAHVCEKASGRTMQSLLQEYILGPLDMGDTDYYVPEEKQQRLMPMFGISDVSEMSFLNPPQSQQLISSDVEEMYPSTNPAYSRGGHGLFSTTNDYFKFGRMLLNGKSPNGEAIISRKMHEMMLSNRIPESQLPLRIGLSTLPGYGWGLGVRIMMDPGKALALTGQGEFGWAGAASTYFWVDPNEDMVGVIMTQYLGSILPLADDLRAAAYQMLE
jgi:CubicO group peptidase (beta-lactamase class C family)